MNTWKKDGETARVEYEHGGYWAWNCTRGHLAVLSEKGSAFDTLEECEAALLADGWEREGPAQ